MIFLTLGLTLLLLADIILATFIFIKNKNLAYDLHPNINILYVDSQINSGPPRLGEICRFPTVPILRIWGDGLTFLDNSFYEDPAPLYAGHLSPGQIQTVLNFLYARGFISNQAKFYKIWSPSGPNPASDSFFIGVRLKTIEKEYTSGDTPPALFGELIKMIKPYLFHLTPIKGYDAKIDGLNIGTRDCTIAETPTPAPTPTPRPGAYP